ncbi:rCG20869 [Rattus norvegicus]|uniref:RCG20869 n=1 Tax=Rattus norvegicus TaxID=10116 RepID=A6JES0_RAT|nr:rCG20869 [Rattus norvegicus]
MELWGAGFQTPYKDVCKKSRGKNSCSKSQTPVWVKSPQHPGAFIHSYIAVSSFK